MKQKKIEIAVITLLIAMFSTSVKSEDKSKVDKEYLKIMFQEDSKPTGADFGILIDNTYTPPIGEGLELKDDSLKAIRQSDYNFKLKYKEKLDTLQATEENFTTPLKEKLDSLNYSENNFADSLFEKLRNIEHRATHSDHNFADSSYNKLNNIDPNANDYQLPLATYDQLGGIKIGNSLAFGQDNRLEVSIDPSIIQRQYANDTTASAQWTQQRKKEDKWTKIRMFQITTPGDTTYGDWNPPYRLNNQELEALIYNNFIIGNENIIIGKHQTNAGISRGEHNTLLGNHAGYSIGSEASSNVYIGEKAGHYNTKGSGNVVVGTQAGEKTKGSENIFLGMQAGQNKTHNLSVLLGAKAAQNASTMQSIFIGYHAGRYSSGPTNIAIGSYALQGNSQSATINSSNIAIGNEAGKNALSADHNILIGQNAGKATATYT